MGSPAEDDVKVRFGRRLAELRKSIGWSQEKLSLGSGVARSYLGGVERGQRNIALINICRLAATLGVPAYALLDFDGDLDT
ncbi:helix-turn-helix transcriptional regulator [Ramlibacter ginsenosidimutans]|uniref:Helix-turn-helix transcriptional regulator n=1 Tax=Ramlibacter ginsenosidimutans TaxID=502333 RepID=A0A934TSQ5_9BURK|nr:helix-turn-helix transcriptional regulator [Ramlibacter ginsenosidimutans]MBK6006837.1 helix-turn-helix transcriptional regulator [Ramlibacter ginsenosidimutans]